MKYRMFEDPDAQALASITSLAFGLPVERASLWWEVLEKQNLRVVDRDGAVVAGLAEVPMGYHVGEKQVVLHGIAGVGVHPTARGRGVGRWMMHACLQDLHQAGVALSALYASTRSLYRRVGYGIGGRRYTAQVNTAAWRAVGTQGTWRVAADADWPAIEALYDAIGRRSAGWLARGSYLWKRVRAHRGTPNDVYVNERDGRIVAWVALRQVSGPDDWVQLTLEDHGAVDARATDEVMGFLSTFAAMAPTTTLECGPEEPLLDRLPEARAAVRLFEPWLMRVVHLVHALEARGYPAGLRAEVSFEVHDPVLPQNQGPWHLEVVEGCAKVCRVDTASTWIDVRGLAGLYTSEASVGALHRRGLLRGPNEELAVLASLFAGAPPSIQDTF